MIDNTKEYILCAAIHFKDGEKYEHQPYNITTGLVLCGWRHGTIFVQWGGMKVKDRKDIGITEEVQGFLTSLNRFVTREEAAEIAISQNQFFDEREKQLVLQSKYLFSENIY